MNKIPPSGDPMRVLCVAYCMSNPEGDSLIGVYKRSMRVGLELVRRGHTVYMFCTGRERFHDYSTDAASRSFQFLDFGLKVLFPKSDDLKRRYFRRVFSKLKFDLVVIGEMPLAGTLLDCTLCATELGVPVVFLDNAYSPELARLFYDVHGPMADGMVLTGPSLFQTRQAPARLRQVAPFIEMDAGSADSALGELGLRGSSFLTALAYETKAETLAALLLQKLGDEVAGGLFLTADPAGCRERLRKILTPETWNRVHVFNPKSDFQFFGLVAASQLVIGKCGFMQVAEALSLRSPFIGVFYRGCFSPDLLPRTAQRFVHKVEYVDPDPQTIAAAKRFLRTDPSELDGVHVGSYGSASQVADFLECVSASAPEDKSAECERMGYSRTVLQTALEAKHANQSVRVNRFRCTRLRNLEGSRIDSIVCLYTAGGQSRAAYLWGRRYDNAYFARKEMELALQPGSGRRVLTWSEADCVSIETDAGERLLPPLGF